jgi:zinc and cadmium transporter
MVNFLPSLISVLLVSAVSLIGAIALVISENKLKRFIHYFISFAVGALLGEVFLHLLPEMSEYGFTRLQGIYILFGVLLFLILEKLILWHHSHTDHEESVHAVVWLTLIGDGVHNVLDGMLIAATYIVSMPLGIATTIAVLFHEIPHELGDFMVLIHGGLKAKSPMV